MYSLYCYYLFLGLLTALCSCSCPLLALSLLFFGSSLNLLMITSRLLFSISLFHLILVVYLMSTIFYYDRSCLFLIPCLIYLSQFYLFYSSFWFFHQLAQHLPYFSLSPSPSCLYLYPYPN